MFSENQKVQMQDFLRKKLLNSDDGGGVHINRDEVETVGANMGLDPDQAARLFESIGGDHWRPIRRFRRTGMDRGLGRKRSLGQH
jgi:hypothetical protein